MATHALQDYTSRTELSRWIFAGFLSGALSVVLFHQGAAALLHALEITPHAPYSMQPTRPFDVPVLWSIIFWGGVWGAVLAATLARVERARLVLAATLFGIIFPTLVAWFVVAPLKGQPMAAGFAPVGMAVGLIVNGSWGLGTGLGLALFGRPRTHEPA